MRRARYALAALLVAVCAPALWAAENGDKAPAYPEPQVWKKAPGTFDVRGCSVFVPAGSSAKADAVAEALRGRLAVICGTDLPVKKASEAPAGTLMLCVAKNAPGWKALAGTLDMKAIPERDIDGGYALRIDPSGAAAAARTARGLSHAAITLMDIARRAEGGPLPLFTITDWPDMPMRGFSGTHVFNSATVNLTDIRKAAAHAPAVKQGMLFLELDTGAFRLKGHPELHRTGSWDRDEYAKMVRLPLDEGIDVVPWINMGKSISLRFGVPYAPLDDDDATYLWGFETVADEVLEVFLPRHYCVGMNEDWHYRFGPWRNRGMGPEHWKSGSKRTVEDNRAAKKRWRDACVRFAEYLRRRGVSTWAIADFLIGPDGMGYGGAWGREVAAHGLRNKHRTIEFYASLLARQGIEDSDDFYNGSVLTSPRTGYPSKPNDSMSDEEFERRFKALKDEYRAYAESFPRDFVFFPKKSGPPHTIAFGNMVDAGCRTVAFSPYVSDPSKKRYPRTGNGQMWAAAIRYLRRDEKKPAAQGAIAGRFGGGWYSMHSGVRDLQNIMSAGPHWHVDSVENQLVDCAKYFVAPSKEESAVSLGWRALLDADPRGSLPEVIQRVKDPTWRWTEAREDVVARGLPAVPALCAAMKSNGGELRQRFEGCVSRIARDARNGVDRGALDMNAVEGYLSEPKGDLANIAAEAIGAAGPEGVKRLVAGLAVTKEAAGCAWALGYAKGVDCGTQICNVIAAPGFSPQAKANAARSAGRLGIKAAAGPLAKLIETEKDLAVQREAAWALALLDARDKDRVVATLLRSPDKATRCRAVMALAVLRSPELLKTGHMLAGGDRNEAWIATWALFPGHVFDRHVNAARDRMNPQKDGSFKSDYKEAVKYYRVHLDMLDIEKAVPRDAALALIAKAAPTQKDVILKGLMEQIPKDQNGFEYQNRPWPPKKKK